MPTITRRPLREDELPAAADLFIEAAQDMATRHGMRPPSPSREGVVRAYAHIARTGIFRVAEMGSRIVALACALVRLPWWFLSGFWVDPRLQGRGIGGPLLDEVRGEGERAGATVFFTWSSVDMRAMEMYLRRGLLPRGPLLALIGTSSAPAPDGYEMCDLDPTLPETLARGAGVPSRPGDLAFWSEAPGSAVAVRHRDSRKCVGYFCARPGALGPAAWKDDAHAPAVLDLALRGALVHGVPVRVNVPGVAHAAVRHCIARGLHLATYGHLLASSEIGDLSHYLPSGPLLF